MGATKHQNHYMFGRAYLPLASSVLRKIRHSSMKIIYDAVVYIYFLVGLDRQDNSSFWYCRCRHYLRRASRSTIVLRLQWLPRMPPPPPQEHTMPPCLTAHLSASAE